MHFSVAVGVVVVVVVVVVAVVVGVIAAAVVVAAAAADAPPSQFWLPRFYRKEFDCNSRSLEQQQGIDLLRPQTKRLWL